MRTSRLLSYSEFVQRVRRHRVTDVLTSSALASVSLWQRRHGNQSDLDFPPVVADWSLAAVAKASVIAGNDFRNKAVRPKDIVEMCSALLSVEDPLMDKAGEGRSVGAFLVRTAYEQFPFQTSVFEELARTRALLDWAAAGVDQPVITPAFWEDALGCSLTEFVGVGLLLQIGAVCNGGLFEPSWLTQENFGPILDHLSRPVIERVSERFFLASRAQFKVTDDAHRLDSPYLRRFEFNPLVVHPFIEVPGGQFIAPVPRFALTRVSPTGLYYVGVEHRGKAFSDALGAVFEEYVGRQLQLLEPEVLLHDVEFKRGQRTADWVVVLPKAVLVVEVKATPLSEDARLGGERLANDLARAPGKALGQIDRTFELIRSGHPMLASVPKDRPVIGLIVTLEPYYQCNSELVWQRPAGTPVMLAASRELEHLVSLSEPVDEVLLEVTSDPVRSKFNLGNAIAGRPGGRNPILEEAWKTYAFEEAEGAEGSSEAPTA
jgi:hypothetical protein